MKSGILICLCAIIATGAFADDAPMFPKPQKEHEWLQKFVGKWETHSKASMGPGQPDMECNGQVEARMIGGFWIQSEMTSELMSEPMKGLQMIGFDPKRKKYIGTWADSMTSHLWIYEGSVDESGKTLSLEAEGPNFMDPKAGPAKFRDVYEFKSNDEIAITSEMLGEDGKWITFMKGTSRRKK